MILTIKEIKEVEETSKKPGGRKYMTTIVKGIAKGWKDKPDQEKSIKLLNFKHGDFIKIIKQIGVGGTALLKYEPGPGGYKDLVSVAPYTGESGGNQEKPKEQPAPEQPLPAPPPFPIIYPTQPLPNNAVFIGCLKVASTMVLGMMEHCQNFERLIKRTATPDLVKQLILEMALYFYHHNPDFQGKTVGANSNESADGESPTPPDAGEAGADPDNGDPEIPF